MRVAILKEIARAAQSRARSGDRRKAGSRRLDLVVEPAPRGASFSATITRGSARRSPNGRDPGGAEAVVKVQKPSSEEIERLPRVDPDWISPAAQRSPGDRTTREARSDRVRARVDSADHARPADGCAVVPGNRRRLQGRPGRSRQAAAVLSDADDRGRDRGAREGARPRRGVAGLQAIATARRLGAVVSGSTCDPSSASRSRALARRSSTSAWSARAAGGSRGS